MPDEYTRVRDKVTGVEKSVQIVNPARHEVLTDRAAVRGDGRPLAAKPRVDKAGEPVALSAEQVEKAQADVARAQTASKEAGK